MNFAGNSVSGSLETANAFNQHFASVLKEEMSSLSLPPASTDPTTGLEDMYFTESDVMLMILSCQSSPESFKKILPFLMKRFSAAIVPGVTEISNKNVDEQGFPKSWKEAKIRHLHKTELEMTYKITDQCQCCASSP